MSTPSRVLLPLPLRARYNRRSVPPPCHRRLVFSAVLLFAALGAGACAVPLGPGYTVEKQTVNVHFVPSGPRIEITGEFRLLNTGTQPLAALEVLLPEQRYFHASELRFALDGAPLPGAVRVENGSRIAQLTLPAAWGLRQRHALQFACDLLRPEADSAQLDFASDAFYLPAEDWVPRLLPPPGLFASGGAAPAQWDLSVGVPQGFLVHASGEEAGRVPAGGEVRVRFAQHARDRYPFVTAGAYRESQKKSGSRRVYFWTRQAQDAARLQSAADSLARAFAAYDEMFGERGSGRHVWIVECPGISGCARGAAEHLQAAHRPGGIAESAFLDSAVLGRAQEPAALAAAAAPLLAVNWLGYGQDPALGKQQAPLSELPDFAANLGREAVQGPQARQETIQAVLAVLPRQPTGPQAREREPALEKSLLFFYALQDEFGKAALSRALRHMLQARRGRGCNLNDLIAALEQETHRNVAEFVRLWMKHPGVPAGFRARYESQPASAAIFSKESTP
ncbi:MAG: hypothetical protein LAN84_11245 [Acidobacteriia bacterium]|nr:hypothetical protein [Terriglobia bacterium]